MNIFIVSHYAGSIIHGMQYRPFYLAKEWLKLGHQVTIIAASFSHLRSRAPHITGNLTEERVEGIRYMWIKTPSYHGNGVKRVFNMLTFVSRLSCYKAKLIQEGNPDVVIAASTYPLDIYPSHQIAKSAKALLIFEVHDLWPLSPIELGDMSPWHPFILLMQRAENFAYSTSDLVVSMLPKTIEHMQKHGLETYKFNYIPNGINIAEWEGNNSAMPQQHTEILMELRRKGHFIVGYAGSHGVSNALHILIEAASFLQTKAVTLVLVGQGPEKESLQQKAFHAGLKNIIFLPPVPKSSIPALLASMDAVFIGWQKKPIYRFGVSPNKLMDYMMAAKPVIHAVDAGNDMVAESGCGISIPPEHPEAIAKAVIQLMNMTPEEREIMGLKGKEHVLTYHDYTVLARQFLDVMEARDGAST